MKKIILLILFVIFASFVCAETFTYKTGLYEPYDIDEWTVLYINNGDLWETDRELNEPVTMQRFNVSSEKAIKNIELKSTKNPKEFNINLPQIKYKNEETYSFTNRDCDENKRDPYIVTWSYDYADTASILLEVHPLEIIDCEKGEFALYTEMEIEVEYYEENKIKSIEHTGLTPGEKTTITFDFENREKNSKILIFDDWGNELVSKKVDSDKEQVTITVPEDTPNLYFRVEYYEDDEIVDRTIIKKDLSWGKMDFRVLVSEDSLTFPLAVQIDNTKAEEIKISLRIASTNKDLEEMTILKKTINAPEDSSIHYINFKVTDEEKINDISIEATHNGITEYAEHNSIVRFTHDEVKAGLPKSPGQEFAEELLEKMKDPDVFESEDSKKIKSKTNMTWTIIGAIIAVILIAGIIVFSFKYLRKEKY